MKTKLARLNMYVIKYIHSIKLIERYFYGIKNSESRRNGLRSSILIDLHDIRVFSSTLGFKILGHTQVLSS